jgi:hypothetical protein
MPTEVSDAEIAEATVAACVKFFQDYTARFTAFLKWNQAAWDASAEARRKSNEARWKAGQHFGAALKAGRAGNSKDQISHMIAGKAHTRVQVAYDKAGRKYEKGDHKAGDDLMHAAQRHQAFADRLSSHASAFRRAA